MTAVFALIGHPVGHSRSPAMHRAWIRAAGIDAVYVPLDVGPDPDGSAVVSAVRTLGLAGANVTVPLKERVAPHLDALGPAATASGAVNTVVRQDGRLVGHDTDGAGLCDALTEVGRTIGGASAVVIGAGGAGRSVAAALCERGARVDLLNRSAPRLRAAADHLRAHGREVRPAGLVALEEAVGRADIVVNALSGPGTRVLERVDAGWVRREALWVDLNYWMAAPPVLASLRARGVATLDGLPMLIHQGARAFGLLTGREAAPAVGRRALGPGDAD